MVSPTLPAWLQRIYPFSPQGFVTKDGARMSYVDEGPRADEAVLFLHGNPTWSFFFRGLIQALAPRIRCVAPDHIGMGLSDKPARYPYDLPTRIRDVADLVAALGLRRVHLVVHDWGGAIGFGWAVAHPELVASIVILNTAAFPSSHMPARISLCRLPGVGEFLVRGLNAFADGATWMATAERRLTLEERRAYLWPYNSWAHRVAIYRFVRDIPLEPTHPSRHALDATAIRLTLLADRPKLILWGGRDFCFDDRFLTRWREIYPDAAVHRYERAGHYVLEDAGLDAIQRVMNFIQTNQPSPNS